MPPLGKDYRQVKEDQQQAHEDKAALEHYDTEVVQVTKEKMKKGEMSHEDLEKALEDIKAEMPRAVTEVMNPVNEQEKVLAGLSVLESVSLENAPDMKTHFETVRFDVPRFEC
jgi:ribosome recycling factor